MNPGVYGPLDSATNLYTGLPINKQRVSMSIDIERYGISCASEEIQELSLKFFQIAIHLLLIHLFVELSVGLIYKIRFHECFPKHSWKQEVEIERKK